MEEGAKLLAVVGEVVVRCALAVIVGGGGGQKGIGDCWKRLVGVVRCVERGRPISGHKVGVGLGEYVQVVAEKVVVNGGKLVNGI